MMLSIEEVRKYMTILKIDKEDLEAITLKDVSKAFQHPDKVGDESKAAFQVVMDAYEKLRDYLNYKNNHKDSEVVIFEDEDEQFFHDNFQNFNFPHENKGSFTVNIEHHLADTWQECLTNMLGESNVRLSNLGNVCDRYWKISYTKERTIDITIHIYNKPLNKKSSKLMIQGSIQSMICSYVFNELPKVYKIVCEMAPKPLEQPVTKKLKPQVNHWLNMISASLNPV